MGVRGMGMGRWGERIAEGHRGQWGLGVQGGRPGFLLQQIPFGDSATIALLLVRSCWAVGPLCGEA